MLRRLFWMLACAFALLAALAVVRAGSLVGRPFPGFLVSANGMVGAFGFDDWPGVRAGLDAWDVIVEIDGQPVGSSAEILEAVRQRPAGTVFRYGVLRGGERIDVFVPSRRFGLADFLREPMPWILTGIFVGAAGLVLHAVRPGSATFGFAALGLSLGVALFRLDLIAPGHDARFFQAILPLVPAALLHLALVFPRRAAVLARFPLLLSLPWVLSVALGAARGAFLFGSPGIFNRLDQLAFLYCGVASVVMVAAFARAARYAPDIADRERARVVLLGLVPAIVCSGAGLVTRLATGSRGAATVMALLAVWLWMGSLALAAAKRDLFRLEEMVREGLGAAIAWGATVAFWAAAVAVGSVVLRSAGYPVEAQLPALGVVIAIPFLPGLFRSMRRRMEERLFPLRGRLLEVVASLSESLATSTDAAEACRTLEEALRMRVGLRQAVVFPGDPPGDLPLAPVIAKLRRGEHVSVFDGGDRARSVHDWMSRSGFTVLLPLVARSRLYGVLGFGDPPGSRLLNSEDLDALSVLASRLAISLSNAEAWERIRELENRMRDENRVLREELELDSGFPEIVGRSPAMASVLRMIEQVALVDTTVLLLGETGTGKNLVARAIHARSPRREGPLVVVSCGAIPAGLVESELFGHERGAFTGATSRRFGKFELARRGTIVLDEVAELPLEAQAKLLRVIQEREFERVGGSVTLVADVRVVAATNRDLAAEVAAGRFREDLFFRLNVFPLRIPPLRERREDLPLLVDTFIAAGNARFGKQVAGLSAEDLAAIERYPWPGNVRELENVIERAMVVAEGCVLSLPPLEASEPTPAPANDLRPLADVLRAAKIAAIDHALTAAGSQARAAEMLGLKAPSLSRMMRDLGLRR